MAGTKKSEFIKSPVTHQLHQLGDGSGGAGGMTPEDEARITALEEDKADRFTERYRVDPNLTLTLTDVTDNWAEVPLDITLNPDSKQPTFMSFTGYTEDPFVYTDFAAQNGQLAPSGKVSGGGMLTADLVFDQTVPAFTNCSTDYRNLKILCYTENGSADGIYMYTTNNSEWADSMAAADYGVSTNTAWIDEVFGSPRTHTIVKAEFRYYGSMLIVVKRNISTGDVTADLVRFTSNISAAVNSISQIQGFSGKITQVLTPGTPRTIITARIGEGPVAISCPNMVDVNDRFQIVLNNPITANYTGLNSLASFSQGVHIDLSIAALTLLSITSDEIRVFAEVTDYGSGFGGQCGVLRFRWNGEAYMCAYPDKSGLGLKASAGFRRDLGPCLIGNHPAEPLVLFKATPQSGGPSLAALYHFSDYEEDRPFYWYFASEVIFSGAGSYSQEDIRSLKSCANSSYKNLVAIAFSDEIRIFDRSFSADDEAEDRKLNLYDVYDDLKTLSDSDISVDSRFDPIRQEITDGKKKDIEQDEAIENVQSQIPDVTNKADKFVQEFPGTPSQPGVEAEAIEFAHDAELCGLSSQGYRLTAPAENYVAIGSCEAVTSPTDPNDPWAGAVVTYTVNPGSDVYTASAQSYNVYKQPSTSYFEHLPVAEISPSGKFLAFANATPENDNLGLLVKYWSGADWLDIIGSEAIRELFIPTALNPVENIMSLAWMQTPDNENTELLLVLATARAYQSPDAGGVNTRWAVIEFNKTTNVPVPVTGGYRVANESGTFMANQATVKGSFKIKPINDNQFGYIVASPTGADAGGDMAWWQVNGNVQIIGLTRDTYGDIDFDFSNSGNGWEITGNDSPLHFAAQTDFLYHELSLVSGLNKWLVTLHDVKNANPLNLTQYEGSYVMLQKRVSTNEYGSDSYAAIEYIRLPDRNVDSSYGTYAVSSLAFSNDHKYVFVTGYGAANNYIQVLKIDYENDDIALLPTNALPVTDTVSYRTSGFTVVHDLDKLIIPSHNTHEYTGGGSGVVGQYTFTEIMGADTPAGPPIDVIMNLETVHDLWYPWRDLLLRGEQTGSALPGNTDGVPDRGADQVIIPVLIRNNDNTVTLALRRLHIASSEQGVVRLEDPLVISDE